MKPFFSIIIPVYNVSPYLRECLDSVLAQSFTNWETICVDDGSSDDSGRILDEYMARDSRFHVVHQANSGVSVARNVGIDMAVGEYITFLDGDDVYEPFWLDGFWQIIETTGAELVRLRMKKWDGSEVNVSPKVNFEYCTCFTDRGVMDWGYLTYCMEGWSVLNAIKRTCIANAEVARFPVGMRFMEDNIFMLKVLPLIHKSVQGGVRGYLYRQRISSVCGDKRSSDMILRLFKEAALFDTLVTEDNKRCFSWMLGRSVLDWRKHRGKGDVGGDAVVLNCVVKAMKDSVINSVYLPKRWKFGFWAVLYMHTFFVIDFLLYVQKIWGMARGVVR